MAIGAVNNTQISDSMLFKTKIRFVINGDVKKEIINVENNKIVREVPPHFTSQILTNLYG